MFVAIFEYIDRLFNICRPRRILYMAIDGVAPRAKMNQQRSRRFRSSKEVDEKNQTIARIRAELEARSAFLPPEKPDSEQFDSNCITPGTPFMTRLSIALRYYIYDRLNSDPGWANIQVILSDANVPGEGEHKIMDFIRKQRSSPCHDPNTHHCLCGADADLIMLGLATHEPHFTIIREEFKPNQPRPCDICGQYGHEMENCVGIPKEDDDFDRPAPLPTSETDFIFVRLAVLRQYLAEELQLPGLPFKWDLERAIDDWVLMCFFVGNDFLPHLPSLEIREGAIDRLIGLYKDTVAKTGGWLTDSGRVNLSRIQGIMISLGHMEDEIFKKRRSDELFFRKKKRENALSGAQRSWHKHTIEPASSGFMKPIAASNKPFGSVSASEVHQLRRHHDVNWVEQNLNNLEAATAMKAMLKRRIVSPHEDSSCIKQSYTKGTSGYRSSNSSDAFTGREHEKVIKELDADELADAKDEVRLWEDGWRTRYYQSKFGVDPGDAPDFCIKVGQEYVKGICWVLAYYYQGCASWNWYFPYHYAPFASDFINIARYVGLSNSLANLRQQVKFCCILIL
ncbi:unnamed protein product [Protopolystoma xenopodis]|uniref:Uncharacterized protein n=1 Tax=Protopolystoma xenopodis TaxID=117903 RepID=A0A448WQ03_9PLAT|nr:unnamed protein product [Protopolystoma xenopodis]